MNLSGIVVAVTPGKINEGIAALNALKNVEVHQSDASSGQIVIVQEAENVNMEIDGLKHIKSLPMVTYAEMVYHYIEDDQQSEAIQPEDLSTANLDETLEKLNR